MSSNGTLPDPEEHSLQEDAPAPKRRRIAFSCLDCRRRKLRCDRVFPACSRCQRGGHAESCTYDSGAVETALTHLSEERSHARDFSIANGHAVPRTIPRFPSVARSFAADEGGETYPRTQSESTTARLCAQEERIRELEYRLIGLEKVTHGTRGPQHTKPELRTYTNPRALVDKEAMTFKGKSFKTQFYGASHHTSCLSHLPELWLFMKDMIAQYHESEIMQREIRNAKVKSLGQEGILRADDQALISLLPQKEVADELIRIYIENLESTYRVLHLPSFQDEYLTFWSNPQQGRPAFAAIILLIVASTYCLKQGDSSLFRGDSSVGRETATQWIRACDSWVQSQSQKHTTLAVFQIHCLSFIAKQINSIKRKRIWTSAGTLMRLVISSGLHRDARIVNQRHSAMKVSIFEQEMRRRIWATISELELQAAFDRGMPAMFRDLVEDCGPPLNLDDEKFDLSTEQLAEPGPISQYTRSSFLHLSRSSWSLRVELVSVINGPNPQLAYEVVLMYDEKIRQHLDEIPHWSDKASLVSRVLLQLQLQILLLYLHRPYAGEEARNSRHDYSAVMHLTSAMKILDLHRQLTSVGNNFLCFFRNDIISAGLSICYSYSTSKPSPDHVLLPENSIKQLSSDPLPCLEKALTTIEDKIKCIGVGLQEYCCICAIIGLLKKTQSSEPSSYEEQRAAHRVARIIRMLMSLQDNYSAAATLASLPKVPVPVPTTLSSNAPSNGSRNVNANGNVHEIGSLELMNSTDMLEDFDRDLEGFDFSNFAEWNLEAFWNF